MEFAFESFERAFKEYGLPKALRTDNGSPFASAQSFYHLTQLSVWWMRLGINVERITPGCPQENGRHERMHLTLKQETTRPPRANIICLLYTSPSPRDQRGSRMPSSA